MAYRFVVLKTPWWECIAAGVPYLRAPGDCMWTVPVTDYRGPNDGPGAFDGQTDVIMNPHRAPELAATWDANADRTILYEAENLLVALGWRARSEVIRAAAPRCRWWNYSKVNAAVFGDEPRPLALPSLPTAPAAAPKDLDVVFVGSMHPRRLEILDRLRRAGMRVAVGGPSTTPLFGAELAAFEARAHVVLSMHYYTPGVFASFRVVPAVARGAVVVAEASEGNEGAEFCRRTAPYGKLASTVLETVFELEGDPA